MNLDEKAAPTKTQNGVSRKAGEFLCVPDSSKPSTWQLPITDKNHKVTTAKLGNAAAALSGGGFRGQPVQLDSKCSKSSIKSKLRGQYKKLGVKPEDMPDSVKARQIDAKDKRDELNVSFFKDAYGEWMWLGAVSNNFLDGDDEILSEKAHRAFEKSLDTGTYKDMFGHASPELWLWHIPVPIGITETVAYDDRGILVAGGKAMKGKVYDRIFEGLAKADQGTLGMSHGMPIELLRRNKDEDHVIDFYMSKEFTILPKESAANAGTFSGAITMKEKSMPLAIEKRKREWFIDTFGSEVVEEFDTILGELADGMAGLPSKEKHDMAGQAKQKTGQGVEAVKGRSNGGSKAKRFQTAVDVAVAEALAKAGDFPPDEDEDDEEEKARLADAKASDNGSDEEDEEDEEEKAHEDEEDDEDKKASSADDDDDDDEEETGMSSTGFDLTEANEEMAALALEIADGIAEPMKEIKEAMATLITEFKTIKEDVKELQKSDGQKLAQKEADTPAASIAALVNSRLSSAIGSDEANMDRRTKESKLGPKETEAEPERRLGIRRLDEILQRQQGGTRVGVPGLLTKNGQQD